MGAVRNVSFLVLTALLAGADAKAAGVDDANAAVLAARDGRYDEAIQLFTSAINSDELNLKSRSQAYAYRGIAKATTGDYEGAQEDLNFAVVLDSDYNGDAYAFRGYFKMVRGDPKDGAADLDKSAQYILWPYNVLWLYLARLRGGVPDQGEHSLAANAAKLDLGRWPGPVVKFMQGQATEAEVRMAANEGDPKRLAERVCDADFYLGEVELAKKNPGAAKPMFQAAAGKCPFASFERMGAAAELTQLK